MNAPQPPILVTPTLQESILYQASKRTALRRHREHVRTLVIGSSHGDYAFDPAHCPDSFNLCSRSQDLLHSSLLYRRASEQCPNLQNLVIFYSVFSPGFTMARSSEKELCPALNEIWSLGLHYEDDLLQTLSAHIRGRLEDLQIEIGDRGYMPAFCKGLFAESYGAARRAADHVKRSRRDGSDLYLVRMLIEARQRGQQVLIVIPPARSDYREALGRPTQAIYAGLFELAADPAWGGPVRILNALDEIAFDDREFGDFDHLRPLGLGTQRLTRRIAEVLG
jgi:hypothetical protein